MALTITVVTPTTSVTVNASVAQASVTASIGDMLIVFVAADNAGTDGTSSITTVSDSGGVNNYTRQSVTLRDPGAASEGATLAIFTSVLTAALSAGTVTANFSPNTGNKVIGVVRVQPGAGETPTFRAVGAGATGASTTPTITATAVANGDTIFGALAGETDDAYTADADTTNGSWSAQTTGLADNGTDPNAMSLIFQRKLTTALGDQTYNPTTSGARDYAMNWITVYPAVAANLKRSFGFVT